MCSSVVLLACSWWIRTGTNASTFPSGSRWWRSASPISTGRASSTRPSGGADRLRRTVQSPCSKPMVLCSVCTHAESSPPTPMSITLVRGFGERRWRSTVHQNAMSTRAMRGGRPRERERPSHQDLPTGLLAGLLRIRARPRRSPLGTRAQPAHRCRCQRTRRVRRLSRCCSAQRSDHTPHPTRIEHNLARTDTFHFDAQFRGAIPSGAPHPIGMPIPSGLMRAVVVTIRAMATLKYYQW